MEILRSTCGLVGTNTYLVSFPSGEHYVIDAPDTNESFIPRIKEKTQILSGILLTHGHFDHTNGLSALLSSFPNTPVYLAEEDWYMMEKKGEGNKEILGRMGIPASFWDDGNPEGFLPYSETCGPFLVLRTPGHTMGSVSFYAKDDKVLFSGDTLFQGGEGRTDLGGSYKAILKSLSSLMELPEETTIYPGHGGITTIGMEKRYR